MTLKKAIDVAQHNLFTPITPAGHDFIAALQILIEAGKRQLAKDPLTFSGMMEPLPGETEE